jgi:hypothetical protein
LIVYCTRRRFGLEFRQIEPLHLAVCAIPHPLASGSAPAVLGSCATGKLFKSSRNPGNEVQAMTTIRMRRLTAMLLGLFVASATLASLGSARTARAQDADKAANQLTDAEQKAGWKLLFDGKTTDGWTNFKRKTIRKGWQVKDGTLACVDPHNAGDIVTADKFDWFELSLEFNIAVGGNSGILFHVTDAGATTWQTGPEVQLQDNVKGTDPERCGWLYQLYKPAIDPKTNKRIDATKPAGEWNVIQVKIAQAPAKSEVVMNGVKYFDFVYGSEDFKARIARSKFARMKDFAKFDSGFLALQGDHGSVKFRNIKIRALPTASAAAPAVIQ